MNLVKGLKPNNVIVLPTQTDVQFEKAVIHKGIIMQISEVISEDFKSLNLQVDNNVAFRPNAGILVPIEYEGKIEYYKIFELNDIYYNI